MDMVSECGDDAESPIYLPCDLESAATPFEHN